MGQPIIESQLYKYTNVVKGWQYRWFILNTDTGILEYYMGEDVKQLRPRGSLYLGNAVISPSEEDSNTFSVNSVNGEIYKLRASDAKERQIWINHLRSVAERHGQSFTQSNPSMHSTTTNRDSKPGTPNLSASPQLGQADRDFQSATASSQQMTTRAQQRVMCNTRSLYDTFSAAQEILLQAEISHHGLAKTIEDLPNSGPEIRCTDSDLLMLKATSQATLLCLKQCLGMLQQQQQANSFQLTGVTGGATMEWHDPFSYSLKTWSNSSSTTDVHASANIDASFVPDMAPTSDDLVVVEINSEDENSDDEESYECEMGSVEEHRALIMQLLSQLKLGMDLTQVVLPTFILEPRSLLEMYADFLGHPDIFLRISEETTPEARILAVVEWYLTSFHIGRKGSSAKKPYNPVIGELFFCSWHVDRQLCNVENSEHTEDEAIRKSNNGHGGIRKLKFVAEQVSHHPLSSAFYVEDSDKMICMNASIGTKSKFLGMSVGINLIGEATISVMPYKEDYVITFPSAYARSILSVPLVELGGKVGVTCAKTGYSASMTFHTKPFYGGRLHRVSGEVKNNLGGIVGKVHGDWNDSLEFSYANGDTKVVDVCTLPVTKKRIRPNDKQLDIESRKMWHYMSTALRENNIKQASEFKRRIEECQRLKIRQWKEKGFLFLPRYFHMVGENWDYNNHLKNVN